MKATKSKKQNYSADDHRASLPHQAGVCDILMKHYYDNKMRELYNEEYKEKTGFNRHGSGFT